jgi:hypothetical protein
MEGERGENEETKSKQETKSSIDSRCVDQMRVGESLRRFHRSRMASMLLALHAASPAPAASSGGGVSARVRLQRRRRGRQDDEGRPGGGETAA